MTTCRSPCSHTLPFQQAPGTVEAAELVPQVPASIYRGSVGLRDRAHHILIKAQEWCRPCPKSALLGTAGGNAACSEKRWFCRSSQRWQRLPGSCGSVWQGPWHRTALREAVGPSRAPWPPLHLHTGQGWLKAAQSQQPSLNSHSARLQEPQFTPRCKSLHPLYCWRVCQVGCLRA